MGKQKKPPALTPAERRLVKARRAFRKMELRRGKGLIIWQLRSKP